MAWIIKDGIIRDIDGDGIRIEGISGGTISGMTISNVGGSGIVISGGKTPVPDGPRLEDLLNLLESRLAELPQDKRIAAQDIIGGIRAEPTTEEARLGFKMLYDLSVNVAGSALSKILEKLF